MYVERGVKKGLKISVTGFWESCVSVQLTLQSLPDKKGFRMLKIYAHKVNLKFTRITFIYTFIDIFLQFLKSKRSGNFVSADGVIYELFGSAIFLSQFSYDHRSENL